MTYKSSDSPKPTSNKKISSQLDTKANIENTRFTMEELKAQIGTSFLFEKSLNSHFKRISNRITTAKIQLNHDHYATIMVAYAPTLGKSKTTAKPEKPHH